MRKMIFAIGLVLAVAVTALAVPNQMTYQGKLTDASGAPISDDTATVQFQIFDKPTGGALLLDTSMTVNTDVQGVFTAIFNGVNDAMTGGNRYLQMIVRGDTLTPRQAMTTAPYAARAFYEPAAKGTYVTSSITFNTTYVTLASLTVTFPSDGFAVIAGNATFHNASAATWLNGKFLEDGTQVQFWYWEPGDLDNTIDMTQTKFLYKAVTAGTKTYTLQASANTGSVSAYYRQLVVMFFPSQLP